MSKLIDNPSSSGGGTWGSITGTLSAQTDLQTALDSRLNLDQATPQTITNDSPIFGILTASELVATDASKKLQSLAVSTYPSLTEIAYVKGVTSAIQTQINAKLSDAPSDGSTYGRNNGAWVVGGGGVSSLSAIGATPNANAATITGSTLNLEPASESFGGVVTTGTQTFAGNKTFTSDLTVSKVSPRITLSDSTTPATAYAEKIATSDEFNLTSQNRVYTIANGLNTTGSGGAQRAAVSLGTVYSVEFWTKKTSGTGTFIGTDNASYSIVTFALSYQIRFGTDYAGGYRYFEPTVIDDGVWTHCVITRNGSTINCYINGALFGVGAQSGGYASMSYRSVGSHFGGTGCAGLWDEVVFWNTDLSLAQVQARYNSGAGAEISSYTNVIAEYKLNSSYTDSSPNAYNLSSVGSGNTFAAGIVSSGVNGLSDIKFLKLLNNAADGSYGNLTLGYYSGTYGTSNIYEGLTHRWNRLGTKVANLDGVQVLFGNSNTDNRLNSIIYGIGNTASLTAGTESLVLVGLSNTGGGHRAGTFGNSNTLGGFSNNWIFGYGNSATGGGNTIIIGQNVTSVPANTIRIGQDNSNYIDFTTAGVFTFRTGGANRFFNTTSGHLTIATDGATFATFNGSTLGLGGLNGSTVATLAVQNTGGSTTRITEANKAVAAQSADQFQLQDSAGVAYGGFGAVTTSATNHRLYLPVVSGQTKDFVHIGTNALTITKDAQLNVGSNANSAITGNYQLRIRQGQSSGWGGLVIKNYVEADAFAIQDSSGNKDYYLAYGASGNEATGMVFNDSGDDSDFRAEGDTDANLFFLDASANTVQIGSATTADSAKFYVNGKISASGEVEINGALNHDGTEVGFYSVAPVVQPTTAGAAATFVANTSAIADDTATFDSYTIGQVVKALRNIGILA